MEEMSIEVLHPSIIEPACRAPSFHVVQDEDGIELREETTDDLPPDETSKPGLAQRTITAWVPERFSSAEVSSEGGDVEVAAIKEGELMVYSGQRQFPLTFQMPESGLALSERRWNAARPGGNVSLRSISATSLDVYTCGGRLNGGSLVAGDVDIDTSGGDAQIGRLMGNHVQLSTQDRGPATSGSGNISVGAIYADTLHLSSGGSVAIEELNAKDAFVTSFRDCEISVKSLSGTCVLASAAQQRSAALSFTLTGQVGYVVASTGGSPISCNLPSGQGQALTVLARPEGAPSLQEIMSAAVSTSTEQPDGLAGWHRLTGLSQQGEAQWELLDSQRAAALQSSLMRFARLACCDYLSPNMQLPSDWSEAASSDHREVHEGGIVLLDARGGPISVLQQSWKEMMQQKLNA